MPAKKTNILNKTISVRRLLLIAIPAVLMAWLVVAVVQSDTYKYMFASASLPNPAKITVGYIDRTLKSHGASIVCESGNNGVGSKNYERPSYRVIYSVADSNVLNKEIVDNAKRAGFELGPDGTGTDETTKYQSIVIENTRPDAPPDDGSYEKYEMNAAVYRADTVQVLCDGIETELKNENGKVIVEVAVDFDYAESKDEYGGANVKHIEYDFKRYE